MVELQAYDFEANIHLFEIKDYRLVLDVNSGALHLLDTLAFDFVKALIDNCGDWEAASHSCLKRNSWEQVQEVRQEIEQAIRSQTLFSPSAKLDEFDYGSALPKALCLNVAHACNMRCEYCFAGQGNFGLDTELMSSEIAYQAIDFLIETSRERKNLELDFFGGEPLLNMEVVKKTIEYGRQQAARHGKQINFTLTTNGLRLDEEVCQFIKNQGLSVILSLDGRPQVHDRMRHLTDKSGSYNRVLPNILNMVDLQPESYYVRGTFTAKNLDFTRDFEHLAALGLQNISLEPATGGDGGWTLKEEHLPWLVSEYQNLAETILDWHGRGVKINFFHFNLDVNQGPCLAKRMTGCGAGVEYLAVTPGGDIYPCHQFIGESDFKMGNVKNTVLDKDLVRRFSQNTIAAKECRHCWARFYCGGGCHANAYREHGDIGIPFRLGCLLQKTRVECTLYLAARLDPDEDD